MKKNILKIILMILGIGILDYGIITEIDGIGRFAIILFGTLFLLLHFSFHLIRKANSLKNMRGINCVIVLLQSIP